MALQSVNKHGIIMMSLGETARSGGYTYNAMDANGESVAGIGQIFLEGGAAGGTKTISNVGKIYWKTAGSTFANAGTNVRVGLQDVSTTTGLEDGTFDVYQDLVGGTDTIAANSVIITTMDTGTKTITHGDVVAVCVEMTTRGGVDTINVIRESNPVGIGSGLPYATGDTGTLSKTGNNIPIFLIEFDDGTLGWFNPGHYLVGNLYATSQSTIDFSNGSTPDEYAAVFKVPFKCSINSGAIFVGDRWKNPRNYFIFRPIGNTRSG
jgi:hypothetical protein